MAYFLTLQNASFLLNNGQPLLDSLQFKLQHKFTAIVGPNGSGKTVLAKMLAGLINLDSGSRNTNALVHYIPQHPDPSSRLTVEDLLALKVPLQAIKRIEAGCPHDSDFEMAEPWWDWSVQLQRGLSIVGLNKKLDLDTPVNQFSGGEQFRLLWLAALLKKPDIYIFDEPTNHVDQKGRMQFQNWIADQSKAVIVVSHDRSLLKHTEAIYEVSLKNLHVHLGGYDHFISRQQARQKLSNLNLESARLKNRLEAKKSQEIFEKSQQRAAQGKRKSQRMNRSALETDFFKDKATAKLSSQAKKKNQRNIESATALETAQAASEWLDPIDFKMEAAELPTNKAILTLENFQLLINSKPFGPAHSLQLVGPQRVHLVGDNGMGKSLLLKSIMGQWKNTQGNKLLSASTGYLDQHFYQLDSSLTASELFQAAHPSYTQNEIQERLARVRLRNIKAEVPFGQLSGGEQIKTALAITLLGKQTPQLLLLDEPTNHLDLESINALEQALTQFKGALIVVSHDPYFINAVKPTHRWSAATGDVLLN